MGVKILIVPGLVAVRRFGVKIALFEGAVLVPFIILMAKGRAGKCVLIVRR